MIGRKAFRLFLSRHGNCRLAYSTKTAHKIGIIGLGNVGATVAKNLLKSGFTVSALHDKDPTAGLDLPGDIPRPKTPRELAAMCDVVTTALPAPPHVKQVLSGEDGVLAGLRSGGVWIDHSTTDYQQTLDLTEEAAMKGIKVLEAPVTGGMALLKQGKMTVLVGGDRQLFEDCLPILQQSGKKVLYMGEMGTATIAKVVSNMLAAVNVVTMTEAMLLGKRGGVDLKSLFDTIRFSAGNTYTWETEAPLVFNGTYDPDFTIGLHCKDLNLGYQLGRKFNVPIQILGHAEQIYNRALYKLGDEVGSTSPAKLLQDELEEPLQVEGFEDWTYTIEHVEDSMAVVHSTKEKVYGKK